MPCGCQGCKAVKHVDSPGPVCLLSSASVIVSCFSYTSCNSVVNVSVVGSLGRETEQTRERRDSAEGHTILLL